jgi:hypothetical protein
MQTLFCIKKYNLTPESSPQNAKKSVFAPKFAPAILSYPEVQSQGIIVTLGTQKKIKNNYISYHFVEIHYHIQRAKPRGFA